MKDQSANGHENNIPTDVLSKPTDITSDGTKVNPPEMLDSVASYIREYLVCNDHQLTLVTLWGLYTWCYQHFRSVAYLDVRSPAPQSGKTLCLNLLHSLSQSPEWITGADSRTIRDRILIPDNTVDQMAKLARTDLPPVYFFDDCQHAFKSLDRQPLVALLKSGTRMGVCYTYGSSQYVVLGPKVFAGNAPLPGALAAHCIPIALLRKKQSDKVIRIEFCDQPELIAKFKDWFKRWARENSAALDEAAPNAPSNLPPGLSPAEQDCAEPLLHIAGRIGGDWPEKARAALAAVFKLAENQISIELLGDIRCWFQLKNFPEYFPTRDLMENLTGMEFRPWSAWKLSAGGRLGRLLSPFGINSRNLYTSTSPDKRFKGYLLKDFQDTWDRYLPPVTPYTPSARKTDA